MQDASVKKLFKEQVLQYSHKNQYIHSPLTRLILQWIKIKKTNKKIEICEFGGSAGQLLGEIRKSYPNYSYTNVEIINDYKKFLVAKEIIYVTASVLNSKFADSSFDIIIMRDVLHHLIGESYKETLSNQKLALEELERLVKPGGAIFLEELVNESKVGARIIYYLSKFNSKIGLHLPSLFISPNVIVAFLTSGKLLDLSNKIFGENNIEKKVLNIETKWYFKLLHLFGDQKKITIVAKKNK